MFKQKTIIAIALFLLAIACTREEAVNSSENLQIDGFGTLSGSLLSEGFSAFLPEITGLSEELIDSIKFYDDKDQTLPDSLQNLLPANFVTYDSLIRSLDKLVRNIDITLTPEFATKKEEIIYTTTDSIGSFSFDTIAVGTYTIKAIIYADIAYNAPEFNNTTLDTSLWNTVTDTGTHESISGEEPIVFTKSVIVQKDANTTTTLAKMLQSNGTLAVSGTVKKVSFKFLGSSKRDIEGTFTSIAADKNGYIYVLSSEDSRGRATFAGDRGSYEADAFLHTGKLRRYKFNSRTNKLEFKYAKEIYENATLIGGYGSASAMYGSTADVAIKRADGANYVYVKILSRVSSESKVLRIGKVTGNEYSEVNGISNQTFSRFAVSDDGLFYGANGAYSLLYDLNLRPACRLAWWHSITYDWGDWNTYWDFTNNIIDRAIPLWDFADVTITNGNSCWTLFWKYNFVVDPREWFTGSILEAASDIKLRKYSRGGSRIRTISVFPMDEDNWYDVTFFGSDVSTLKETWADSDAEYWAPAGLAHDTRANIYAFATRNPVFYRSTIELIGDAITGMWEEEESYNSCIRVVSSTGKTLGEKLLKRPYTDIAIDGNNRMYVVGGKYILVYQLKYEYN